MFWDIMPPSSGSTLKMEAIFYSERSVDTQRTTRRYIPEDGTLGTYLREMLGSNIARDIGYLD
jgi:hypothetical protein